MLTVGIVIALVLIIAIEIPVWISNHHEEDIYVLAGCIGILALIIAAHLLKG